MSKKKSYHLEDKVIKKLKWLQLSELTYVDENSVKRQWDSVERTSRHGDIDGVDIITVIKRKEEEDHFVLVKQYRPPIKTYCIEFPAGLIDKGDTPEEAALRELKEECGYEGKVLKVSEPLAMEPGLTSANCKIVHMEVDGDLEVNKNPKQHLEETEQIEVLLVKKNELMKTLKHYAETEKCYIDSKLWTFSYGLMFT